MLGTTVTIKLSSEDTNGRLAAVEHSVPRQAGPPPHIHHLEDELFYVLEGEFEFALGDPSDWQPAPAGNWVFVPAGMAHASRCVSDHGRLLSIYAPGGAEAFFCEMETIDQSDQAAVLALADKHHMSVLAPAAQP